MRRRSYENIKLAPMDLESNRENQPTNILRSPKIVEPNQQLQSIQCSFCPSSFSSSAELRSHLMLCGNKTDQCPNCRQYIRRAYFTYHYENDCAQIDEQNTPMAVRKVQSPREYQHRENYPNGVSPRSTEDSLDRDRQVRIQCRYCRRPYLRREIPSHEENCTSKPSYDDPRQLSPVSPNHRRVFNHRDENGTGAIHIPCEYCLKQIDLPNWSRHTQQCREREDRRIANKAQVISRQPVEGEFPCEYCNELFPASDLMKHQKSCIGIQTGRRPAPRPGSAPLLQRNRPRSRSAGPRGLDRPRAVYQSLDVSRTKAANQRTPLRRSASDDYLQPRSDDDEQDQYQQNVTFRTANGEQSMPRQNPPLPNANQRRRDDDDPRWKKSKERERIIDGPSVSVGKRKKKSKWYRMFCGGKGEYD